MADHGERVHDPEHARRIRAMFGRIARRYDLMNSLITFGRDRAWRAAAAAAIGPCRRVLDVATGTGVLAAEVLRREPGATVVGVDFALPMLREGLASRPELRLLRCQADALALPFADASFDAAVSGFLLRNVSDLRGAIAEQVRVVRPGGRVVCLESSPARSGALRPLATAYMHVVIPFLARLFAGDAPAYKYLAESTSAFLPAEELAHQLARAGLRVIAVRTFMRGTVALLAAEKPAEAPRQ